MNDNGRLRCLCVGDYYPKGCMIYHKMTIYPSLNNGYKINIELSSPNDYREEVPGGKGIIEIGIVKQIQFSVDDLKSCRINFHLFA